jgi:hypothetical protein
MLGDGVAGYQGCGTLHPFPDEKGDATMFHAMVEERIRERHVLAFDRTLPGQEERERDASQILEKVSESLRPQLNASWEFMPHG